MFTQLLFSLCLAPQALPQQPSPSVSSQGLSLAFYDVHDLVERAGLEFPAPALGVVEDLEASAPAAPPADEHAQFTAACQRIAGWARDWVALDSPAGADALQMGSEGSVLNASPSGTLWANLTAAQHARLRELLDYWRGFEGFVEVQARFLEGEAKLWESSTLELPNTQVWSTPNQPQGALVLPQAAVGAFEEWLSKAGPMNVMQAPKVQLWPTASASICTTNEVVFVSDWKMHTVEPDAREIADPRLARILEGSALDVRVLPMPGNIFIVSAKVQHSRVKRPIRTAEVALGREQKRVEVALPEADTQRFEITLRLREGDVALSLGVPSASGTRLAIQLEVRRTPREGR